MRNCLKLVVMALGLQFSWVVTSPVYAKPSSSVLKKKSQRSNKTKPKRKTKNYMEGPASFYAQKFEGRKMANGSHYWSDVYTAAHAKLPLGTKLKVTSLTNGKVLYVEVTDRMASWTKYILDLSPAAARYLNGTGHGLRVKLEIVNAAEFESHDMNREDVIDNHVAAN